MCSFTKLLVYFLFAGSASADYAQGIYDLVKRRMPQHADSFQFSPLETVQNSPDHTDQVTDQYVVSTPENGTVLIEGNSLSALSYGLHRYLADVAHVDMWWFIGNRLDIAPEELPTIEQPITGSSVAQWRYHFNTVTFDYMAAFWSWSDWEFQLDWMALRGINLSLAWVGYEKILLEVFKELGLTDAEISTFFTGPAFQAWNRLGNIQGFWGDPLPNEWIESQFELQKKILARMVELGITPVLPSFTGFVPRAITRVLPNAKVVPGSRWNVFSSNYTCDTFLEPFDDNFALLQKSTISKQQAYYGNISHIYALDQYNENNPFSSNPDYLRNISRTTSQSLKAADPDAVWLMQSWLFLDATFWNNVTICAYLSGVENNSDMLILDLFAESQPVWQLTDSYYGKPWIWCQVHDYGGNMGLYGQIMNITENATAALASSGSMVGFGHTMESQEGNEIVYDLLLDQAWSETPINTSQYFEDWVTVRYAGTQHVPQQLFDAWEILRWSAYNNTNLASSSVPKSILELEPSISGLLNREGHHPTTINYDPELVVEAWALTYEAALLELSLWDNPAFNYDLIFLTRQVLVNAFIPRYELLISFYNNENYSVPAIVSAGRQLIDLLQSLDTVLGTNECFQLAQWINKAVSRAHGNTTLAAYYEYNARNQITLWGPNGEISDYASKQWAGLISSYYVPRWQILVDYLQSTCPDSYDPTNLHQIISHSSQIGSRNWTAREIKRL
uniref:Alpha-N-acetylglucosaminidase n=1 Tax=Talaromyces marneffei PM1 TaxID=1077442 RepID=A0A093V078_TALMA